MRLKSEGVSDAAARQRLSRARGSFKRLAGLRFTKNTRFAYLESQYGTPEFWIGIEEAFSSHGRAYWGALVGLKARGGSCPQSMFPIVSGAPDRRKGQLSPARIYDRLFAINLVELSTVEKGEEPFIKLKPHSYNVIDQSESQALIAAEYVAINAVKMWAKNIGLGSFGKFRIRGDSDLPDVAGVAWDITAPSYTRPLVSFVNGKLKPGFLVADVNLYRSISIDQVVHFSRKYNMAAGPKNVAPILALLIANQFSPEAFDKAKSLGMLPVTISNLFGESVAKALQDLISLLSDAGATAAVNPGHLRSVMRELTKIEGSAANLRGALFELVVGSLVKDVESGYLSTGLIREDYQSKRKAEIDVLLDIPMEVPILAIECKAKIGASKISRQQVKDWLEDRVPLILSILQQEPRYKDRKVRFEFWTNGTFHYTASEYIASQATEYEQYTVAWKDGSEIKNYANKSENRHIKSILSEHYFRNPLTMVST